MTNLQYPQTARAHECPSTARSLVADQSSWPGNDWLRAAFAFAAAVALAVVLLFALVPEPVTARSGQAGSVFSATTANICTLPRFEARATVRHIADKPNRSSDGPGDAYVCGWRAAVAAGGMVTTGQALHAATPVQDHAARTAEARAPPRA